MSPFPDQVDQIMAVMEASFDPAYGEAWNRRQVSDALTLPHTFAIVVDTFGRVLDGSVAGEPAGFVLSRHAADEEELLLIAVSPDCRGAGLGLTLVEQLFADAKTRGATRMFLEMRRGNPAVNLYKKVGFEPIGVRTNYYNLADGSKVDAITFGKTL
ncbi:GNAT family N-acetyltransferase [uncultured Erythrobacter sp.]|uniref:GNAT family N-acetyltransferase n=1 Tax=uncultured Erythrobacter sp. TaxID=263913 RepID=UPI002633287C|nr:GNAT family N-acetyltransferase [uncultured Erythrobacter sp.]